MSRVWCAAACVTVVAVGLMTGSFSAGAAARHCPSSQLSVQFRSLSAASGRAYQDLAFVNHGPLCTLRGWPTITFLDASGADLPLRAPSRIGEPVRTVTITDGGRAYFTFKYINEGFCSPRATVSAVRFTPPGAQDGLVLHRAFSLCTPDPGALVYPVRSTRSFAPAPARTIATVVQGFTPDGRPTITYSERRGHCFFGSLSTSRRDAWRCETGNLIYDPCFNSSHAPGRVACPVAQLDTGLVIRLTRALPSRYRNTRPPSVRLTPWNVWLTGGQECQWITGASGIISGQRVNYGCTGRLLLLGTPHRTRGLWTITAVRSSGVDRHTVRIAYAWM